MRTIPSFPSQNREVTIDPAAANSATFTASCSSVSPRDVRARCAHRARAVVFADQSNTGARELLAVVYDQLGYGSENGTWRNFYLQGVYELRHDEQPTPLDLAPADVIAALTVGQLFDTVAIRVNGPRAWNVHASIDWIVTDEDVRHRTELSNGVLDQRDDPAGDADLTVTLTKAQLIGLPGATLTLTDVDTRGGVATVEKFLDVLDPGNPGFAIVTP